MRKRPQQDEGESFDEEPGEQAQAPLPDRTRIEASPFAERPAPGPDRTCIEPLPVPPEPAPARKPRRLSRPGAPSVIVEEKGEAGRKASRAAEPAALEEDWDAPAGEVAEATKVAAPPTSRPPRRRSQRDVERPPEEAEGWDPPPKVDDANATRLAAVPAERERRSESEDENATQAGPPISIEVVQGPDEGLRLPVRGGRMIVGRGDGCDLKLKDAASSRRHCELVGSPSGVVVRDLGSGNGTRVNGERITEAVVNHGDRIALGQTVLLVVDDVKKFEEERQRKLAASHPPRPAPPRRPLPPPPVEEPAEEEDEVTTGTAEIMLPRHRRSNGLGARFRALPKPMRLTVLGGGGLLALLLAFAFLGAIKPAPPPAGPSREETRYDQLFEEGKKLLRAEKHDEALERFKAAQQIEDKAELARYIETCERDGKGAKMLVEAKALAAAGEHVKAIALLKQIDSLASSFDEAKQLTETYEKDRIRSVQADIDKLIQQEDVESARALLPSLPDDEAAAARKRIDQGEREISVNQADRARNARKHAENAKREKLRKARQEVDDAISGVVRKIEVGNFDGAERELDRVLDNASSKHVVAKAQALRKQIPKFADAYREGISKYNGGAYETAADPLLRALKLWEDMDIDGNLGDQLQTKVGKSMEAKGRSALGRQEYGIAARAFREALRFNPNAVEAKAGLKEIERKAKDVYFEGYVEKERDPDFARRKFREVLEMVQPDSQVYQDAKRRLADLDSK